MKKKILKISSIFFLIEGFILLGCSFSIPKIKKVISTNNLESHYKEKEYYAILEIPKIKLKQEIYAKENDKNDVNKNVWLHPQSIMPNDNISNVILAAHSGHSPIAYFKDLYKLSQEDIIKLYYQSHLYTYQIVEIEEQEKDGTLDIKIFNDQVITLITCTKNNNQTQTIYYGLLKKIEKI